jgi:hypothetical protein
MQNFLQIKRKRKNKEVLNLHNKKKLRKKNEIKNHSLKVRNQSNFLQINKKIGS